MRVWKVVTLTSSVLLGKWLFLLYLRILKISYVHFFSGVLLKQKNLVLDYGAWAVVTGASDGIGKCYSQELAKRGLNLVLASRSLNKLQAVCDDIEMKYGVKVIAVRADFSSRSDHAYNEILQVTKNLDVGILVNNVGVAEGQPNFLEGMTRDQIWNTLIVNVCASVAMTHYFLPAMKRKGRGLIVNMGSLSWNCPTTYSVLYGASKAFIKRFSDGLIDECRGTGVEVQTLTPAYIRTNMTASSTAYMQPQLFYPTAEKFSASAVATLGRASNTTGYWPHDLQNFAMETAPEWGNMMAWKYFVNFDKPKKF